MRILTDRDIIDRAKNGKLITENFSQGSVKQACYELRAATRHFTIENGVATRREKSEYLIFPRQYVVTVTLEKLSLPPDILGRILAKGHLFSLGIIPVNTYADPGFEGYLGITLFNGSNDVIKIKEGQTIAKIEFNQLTDPVDHPYRGQHGLSIDVWPVPNHLIVKPEHLYKYGIHDREHLEIYHGKQLARLTRDLDFYRRWIWVQISITFVVLGGLLYFAGEVSLLGAIVVSIGSNLLTALLGLAARHWGWFRAI